MLVLSLEEYDEVTGQAAKAAILQKDVVGKSRPSRSCAAPRKGCSFLFDQKARSICPISPRSIGKPEEQIIPELGDLIFHDPKSKSCRPRMPTLRQRAAKLAAAEIAVLLYARNTEALRGVQTGNVLPGDIDANLGAPVDPRETTSRRSPPSCSRSSLPRYRSDTS